MTAAGFAPALVDLLDAFEDRARSCSAALHDTVLQDLYALRMGAPTLAPEALDARLAGIAGEVAVLIERLSPPLLDDFGLAAALAGLARTRPQQIRVDLPGGERETYGAALPRSAARGLFRVAQEGVESAARHAAGARVRFSVERGAATLTVEEAPNAAAETRARLESSEDRQARLRVASYALALGGTLSVCEPTDPVQYHVRIPLDPSISNAHAGGGAPV